MTPNDMTELKALLHVAINNDSFATATCSGKEAFDTPELASRVLHRKKRHGKIVVYRCRHCRKWHIGNHLGRKPGEKSLRSKQQMGGEYR